MTEFLKALALVAICLAITFLVVLGCTFSKSFGCAFIVICAASFLGLYIAWLVELARDCFR